MKSCLKYLVLLFYLNFIEGVFRGDYKYSVKAQTWFKPVVVPANWFEALLRCSLEGAVLASPTTPEILAEMTNFINRTDPGYEIFTGIHATVSQGDYHTIEGIHLSRIPLTWARNEPDNKDNLENCITLNGNGESADRRCDGTRPYICSRSESIQIKYSGCGIVDSEGSNSFRCDYKYSSRAKGWFKYIDVPSNWNDARLRCALEGAVLASPTTVKIKAEMTRMINSTGNGNEESIYEVFTGIHASFAPGAYLTVDGIPFSKIPHSWAVNEPDNKEDKEQCLTLNSFGELSDVPCDDTRPFICYRSVDTKTRVNECGTVDPEYRLDARTNSCYKFHAVARNFSRAFFTCYAEGGHLAIINSEVEANVLKELFAKYPGGEMVGNFWKDAAFIGFHDWGERWDFRTIHGQTLTEAGYVKFSGGEPNNFAPGESCGAIYRSGLLDDLWCDRPVAFICEKDPDYPEVCRATTEED